MIYHGRAGRVRSTTGEPQLSKIFVPDVCIWNNTKDSMKVRVPQWKIQIGEMTKNTIKLIGKAQNALMITQGFWYEVSGYFSENFLTYCLSDRSKSPQKWFLRWNDAIDALWDVSQESRCHLQLEPLSAVSVFYLKRKSLSSMRKSIKETTTDSFTILRILLLAYIS